MGKGIRERVRVSERKMACRWWLKGSVCTTAAEKHPSMIFCLNHNFFFLIFIIFSSHTLFLFTFSFELALLTFENHFFHLIDENDNFMCVYCDAFFCSKIHQRIHTGIDVLYIFLMYAENFLWIKINSIW